MNIQNKSLKTFLILLIPKACMYPAFGSDSKASAYYSGDLGSIPGSGRSPGEGNGNPLQDSCLENPMDGEAWWATVHGVTKSRRTQLSDFTLLYIYFTLPFTNHILFVV